MAPRRLYEILGLACGFILIDYGFSLIAAGFPGAREHTSQFIAINLLIGGSAIVFASLYSLLSPIPARVPIMSQPGVTPEMRIESVVRDEEAGSHYSLYRQIEYAGYFFTGLGLFSAAYLVLQVFISSPSYNVARWSSGALLVVFGVLSYAIFRSIGRLGAEEERQMVKRDVQATASEPVASTGMLRTLGSPYHEILEVRPSEFSRCGVREYERHLSGNMYDMLRTEQEGITVWREDRRGIRSVYLAGPYELNRRLLEEHVGRREELKIGFLSVSVEAMRDLLELQKRAAEGTPLQ